MKVKAEFQQLLDAKERDARVDAVDAIDAWVEALRNAREAAKRAGCALGIPKNVGEDSATNLRAETERVDYLDLFHISKEAAAARKTALEATQHALVRYDEDVTRDVTALNEERYQQIDAYEADVRQGAEIGLSKVDPAIPKPPGVVRAAAVGLVGGALAFVGIVPIVALAESYPLVLELFSARVWAFPPILVVFALLGAVILPAYRYSRWRRDKDRAERAIRKAEEDRAADRQERERRFSGELARIEEKLHTAAAAQARVLAALDWLKGRWPGSDDAVTSGEKREQSAENKPDTYPVEVDYSLTLGAMVARGNFVPNPQIGELFTISGFGRTRHRLQLVSFDQNLESKKVVAALKARGLRPGRAEEVLAFGATYPDYQLTPSVVALGSVSADGRVIKLFDTQDLRMVVATKLDHGWAPGTKFLAAPRVESDKRAGDRVGVPQSK